MGTSNQPLIRSMVRRGWHVVRTQGIMVVGVLLVAVGLTLAITTHGWPVRATFLMGLGLALASEGLRQKAKAAGRLTDFRRSGAVVVFSLLMVDAVLPLSPLHRQIDQIVIRMMQLGIAVTLIVWAIRLIRRWATRREPGVAQPVWHPPAATVRCFRCKQEIVTSMSRCPSCSALLTAPYALEYLPGKGRMAACQTGHNWRSVLRFHR